jgi:hypothetical protein
MPTNDATPKSPRFVTLRSRFVPEPASIERPSRSKIAAKKKRAALGGPKD